MTTSTWGGYASGEQDDKGLGLKRGFTHAWEFIAAITCSSNQPSRFKLHRNQVIQLQKVITQETNYFPTTSTQTPSCS